MVPNQIQLRKSILKNYQSSQDGCRRDLQGGEDTFSIKYELKGLDNEEVQFYQCQISILCSRKQVTIDNTVASVR